MAWYQQGDLTIKPVSIPDEAEPVDSEILAQGVATGHAHRVVGHFVLLRLYEELFLRVLEKGAKVIHEEHKAFPIPPGEYRIGAVREYDHFAESARFVFD